MNTQHMYMTQWHIDMFPWHINDEFMYFPARHFDEYIHRWPKGASATWSAMTSTEDSTEPYIERWSHRSLANGVNP